MGRGAIFSVWKSQDIYQILPNLIGGPFCLDKLGEQYLDAQVSPKCWVEAKLQFIRILNLRSNFFFALCSETHFVLWGTWLLLIPNEIIWQRKWPPINTKKWYQLVSFKINLNMQLVPGYWHTWNRVVGEQKAVVLSLIETTKALTTMRGEFQTF